MFWIYREDLEKQEECGVVAHERLTEPRVTMEWLLAKRNSLSNLPDSLGPVSQYQVISQYHWIF